MVRVSGKDFTLNFAGARILGPGARRGFGILITDARNVTIKNANVSGCLWGIVIERSVGVKLLNCTASRNGDLPPGTVIDESGKEPEDQWGGGILILDSRNCLVRRCAAQYQWDGIDLVRAERNTIEDSDVSYCGNWGVHFWGSSRNVFQRNRAIWCTTGAGTLFQALTGWQTYDAQAVGIDHNSNENRIEANDLRFSGDGIFIRANEGPITPGTVVPVKNGSHRNILRNNDCSFSPNNAIEVDFVDDTIIEGNNCSNSNYGMWLGYSRRCVVRNNIAVNCSMHAVEIENGQDALFENNVFGFDTPRPNGQLVYLRQNGRDNTRSGGYRFRGNLFYGAGKGVLLKATDAKLAGNALLNERGGALALGDAASLVEQERNHVLTKPPRIFQRRGTLTLKPGALVTLTGARYEWANTPPVVEVDGIPVWVHLPRSAEWETEMRWQFDPEANEVRPISMSREPRITFWLPADFWDRPAKETVTLRVFTGRRETVQTARLVWPESLPRVTQITPDPARIGDTVTVSGVNLVGGRLLLNNKPARIVEQSARQWKFALPEGILLPTRYNLLWEKGEGESRIHTWPIPFEVAVPTEQQPHLLSAQFEPTTLKVGEKLKVTFVLRNNLPAPARLMQSPKPPYTYLERQAFWEQGVQEIAGTLHLRVTSDRPGPHHPGSWPWLFGFDKEMLAPGETITVEGFVIVQTPGEIEFRVGLVATGGRFIDDNAFRTKITVQP